MGGNVAGGQLLLLLLSGWAPLYTHADSCPGYLLQHRPLALGLYDPLVTTVIPLPLSASNTPEDPHLSVLKPAESYGAWIEAPVSQALLLPPAALALSVLTRLPPSPDLSVLRFPEAPLTACSITLLIHPHSLCLPFSLIVLSQSVLTDWPSLSSPEGSLGFLIKSACPTPLVPSLRPQPWHQGSATNPRYNLTQAGFSAHRQSPGLTSTG